jgi:hypothetical protein
VYFEDCKVGCIFELMKKSFLFLLFAFCMVALAYSQASFDDDVIDVAVPVDGGILTVVGSAMVYGLYKNRKK